MIDFTVYRLEGGAIRAGRDLYGDLGAPQGLRATYPPFAALVFVPFSMLPALLGKVVFNATNLVLIGVVSWQSCRLVGVPLQRIAQWAVLLGAVDLWAEPVYTSLGNGQINLAVLALVLSDFIGVRETRWRGLGTGIAAGLKVTPAVFIVYLLLTRRFRAACVSGAVFAGTVAVSAAVAPSNTWRYWTHYLYDTKRVGDLINSTNQSVPGVISRLSRTDEPSMWLTVAGVLVVGLVLVAAVRTYRVLGDAWGLPLCAVGTLLGSPIAWSHHWVWCVPIAALLVRYRTRLAPFVLIFWTFALFFLPHTALRVSNLPVWQLALTNWYVLFGLAFVITALHQARRASVRTGTYAMGPVATLPTEIG